MMKKDGRVIDYELLTEAVLLAWPPFRVLNCIFKSHVMANS